MDPTPTPPTRDDDRTFFQGLLDEAVDQARHRITLLEREHQAIVSSTELAPTDDEHDPEGSTIAYERELARSLLEDARRHVVNLERAIDRLAANAYGGCARCGAPIGRERLVARPDVDTCVRCAAAGTAAGPV
jgi:DnaK suppressor protein